MSTVLITGASGFFGKALIDNFQKMNTGNHYVCLYHSNKPDINDPRFTLRKIDLLDLTLHKELMTEFKPTYCAHLAWHFPPQKFWHADENLDWIRASVHLFKAFCDANGKIFMGAGSITEYDWFSGVLDEYTTPLKPRSLYSQSKKSLYELLKVVRDVHYKETVLLWPRIAYFFGESEAPQKLISHIIHNLNRGLPLNLASRDIKRPYAHVQYLGKILSKILLNQKEDIVFNLSGSKSYSIGQIVDYVAKIYKIELDKISYHTYDSPVTEPINLQVNISILRDILKDEIPDTFFGDLGDMTEILSKNNS